MESAALVLALGFCASLASGYLGIGGGILLAPALLYLPRLLGTGALTMHEVSGLTIVQALFACSSGAWRHRRYGCVDRLVVLVMGPTIAASSLAGAVLAGWISSEALVLVFAALAVSAAALMWLPKDDEGSTREENVAFSVPHAVAIAGAVGLLGGMVGQGGSFILIPLMLHVLRLPTRVVIGSNLALVFLSSLAGLAGKSATGQVPALLSMALLLGAIPAAQIGSVLSHATPARSLRIALGIVVSIGAIVMVADAVFAH